MFLELPGRHPRRTAGVLRSISRGDTVSLAKHPSFSSLADTSCLSL